MIMNGRQNAKLNMAQWVADTLTAYAEAYTGIEPVKKAVIDFERVISDIRAAATEQIAVQVPVFTQEKRAAEEKMIDLSVRVANTLYVIGFESGDRELINLLGLSDSSFYRVEDNVKLTIAQRLCDLAYKHAAELLLYGYDPEQTSAIRDAISAYSSLIAKPMDAITTRKQKTTNLKELFARLDSALYDRLDKLIVLFKSSHPDFYNEYRTSRNLIDTSHRQKEQES